MKSKIYVATSPAVFGAKDKPLAAEGVIVEVRGAGTVKV